jgi:hypothetical protein
MTDNVNQLLSYQLAEFDECSRRNAYVFTAKSAIPIAAIVSVYSDSQATYALGLIGLGLVIIWFVSLQRYRLSRDVAERARRATLIMGGLGQSISSNELIDIQKSFTVSDKDAEKKVDPEFFASKSEPGFDRLAEMLEESSFWTKELQSASAKYTTLLAFLLFIISIFLVFTAIIFVDGQQLMQFVRVIFVILASIVFSNILVTAIAHYRAADAVERIYRRIEVAKSKDNPKADLLLLLSDYNATVEAAPLHLPFLYTARRQKFNRLWQQRQSLNRLSLENNDTS